VAASKAGASSRSAAADSHKGTLFGAWYRYSVLLEKKSKFLFCYEASIAPPAARRQRYLSAAAFFRALRCIYTAARGDAAPQQVSHADCQLSV
jgi:hypothetical protein